MSYSPPSGESIELTFNGSQPASLNNGSNVVLAFYLSTSIQTGQVQSARINALGTDTEVGGADESLQGKQSAVGAGNVSVWITSISFQTQQGNQSTLLTGVYQAPAGNNVIIDLGTGAYSPPVGNTIVIDLGDTIAITSYTKFLYFMIDTAFF